MFKHPLTYLQMERLCRDLQHLVDSTLLYCAGESLSRFSLVFQKNDQRESLFFCFDPPLVRFHLSQLPPKKHSIERLNALLEGSIMESIEMLNQDRILKMVFKSSKGPLLLIAEFFPRRPNYFLMNQEEKILFSFHSVSQDHYTPPKQTSFVTTISQDFLSHESVEKGYQELEQQKLKNELRQQFEHEIKKQKKKIKQLEEGLQECASWKKVQHEGELLKANYPLIKRGASSLLLFDWETHHEVQINLDPKKTPQEEMTIRFKKAKKLQAGLTHLAKQLDLAKNELVLFEAKLLSLETAVDLEKFKVEKTKVLSPKQVSQEKSLPYKEFISAAGVKIWVGKNAKANDSLTFSYASGSDWWLHVQGFSGSHVIIKTNKGQEPDPQTLQEAMQLALKYSKAKERGEAEICITQRKYLTRLPRQPGKVQVSKHKIIRAKG
jgi:predicted ribosome quality control (RQC) complex YloA/Tae2 family protein